MRRKFHGKFIAKTRRLNKTLQSYGSEPVSFEELSKILSDILQGNVYIASKKRESIRI